MIRIIFAAMIVCCASFALAQNPISTQSPQTQITTTAPVSSDTTISIGTIGGEILKWFATAFVGVMSIAGSAIATRIFKKLGIETTDIMKAQLQAVIVNGLNAGAANVSEKLKGQGQVTIKNAIVADAVKYTQTHASETIKALGLDPQSGAAVEAIKARIETALVDPTIPTPPIITPATNGKPGVA